MILQKANAPNPHPTERRVALEKRRRVAEMSVDEMRRELLTSPVTGLPNRRAFDETGPAPATAMADMDGLKALNKYGYEVGNSVLLAMAHSLRQVGLEAYHDKGDEFLCRGGNNTEELVSRLEGARAVLRGTTVAVERSDGSTLTVTGADFSHGVGKNLDEAEAALRRQKAERERVGHIARGELRGVTVNLHKQKTKDSLQGTELSGDKSISRGGNSFPRGYFRNPLTSRECCWSARQVHSLFEVTNRGEKNEPLAPLHRAAAAPNRAGEMHKHCAGISPASRK
jgi:GGDEF domain-containing protein